MMYRGGDDVMRTPGSHLAYLLRCAALWRREKAKDQADHVFDLARKFAREHGLPEPKEEDVRV